MWNVDYLGLSAALVIMCIILWSWLVLLSSRRHQMTWSLSVKHLHYLVLLLSKRQKGENSCCRKDRKARIAVVKKTERPVRATSDQGGINQSELGERPAIMSSLVEASIRKSKQIENATWWATSTNTRVRGVALEAYVVRNILAKTRQTQRRVRAFATITKSS